MAHNANSSLCDCDIDWLHIIKTPKNEVLIDLQDRTTYYVVFFHLVLHILYNISGFHCNHFYVLSRNDIQL